MPRIKNIFLHCSDSPWGEVLVFTAWHKARGWKRIGYHYIVLNGRPYADVEYWPFLDGVIEPGTPLNDDPIFSTSEVGEHVAGRNSDSLGVCLVGKRSFTDKQLIETKSLLLELLQHFGLTIDDVLGHYEHPGANKTCPNIPMGPFRDYLRGTLSLQGLQEQITKHVKTIFRG